MPSKRAQNSLVEVPTYSSTVVENTSGKAKVDQLGADVKILRGAMITVIVVVVLGFIGILVTTFQIVLDSYGSKVDEYRELKAEVKDMREELQGFKNQPTSAQQTNQ